MGGPLKKKFFWRKADGEICLQNIKWINWPLDLNIREDTNYFPQAHVIYIHPGSFSAMAFWKFKKSLSRRYIPTHLFFTITVTKLIINVGINLKVDFRPLNMSLIEISRSRVIKQSKNSMLIPLLYVLGYMWEEVVILEGLVKLEGIRNDEDLI